MPSPTSPTYQKKTSIIEVQQEQGGFNLFSTHYGRRGEHLAQGRESTATTFEIAEKGKGRDRGSGPEGTHFHLPHVQGKGGKKEGGASPVGSSEKEWDRGEKWRPWKLRGDKRSLYIVHSLVAAAKARGVHWCPKRKGGGVYPQLYYHGDRGEGQRTSSIPPAWRGKRREKIFSTFINAA